MDFVLSAASSGRHPSLRRVVPGFPSSGDRLAVVARFPTSLLGPVRSRLDQVMFDDSEDRIERDRCLSGKHEYL